LENNIATGNFLFHKRLQELTIHEPHAHKVSMQTSSSGPLPTGDGPRGADILWQLFYRSAYLLLRAFWFLFRPKGRGTLVAIWFEQRLLLVKNGYRRNYSLPGGNRRSGEGARAAAVREIREEVGIRLFPNQLRHLGTVVSRRDYLCDHCTYFEVHLEKAPIVRIDGREVVAAVFAGPEEWSAYPLAHQFQTYLNCYRDIAQDTAADDDEQGRRRL
jgi:8-oxo-dGTP diphosphatase